MTTGGLTTEGFIALTVEEIVNDTNATILAKIDPSLDLSPDQPQGQWIGVNADREASAWEAMATIVSSFDPASAEGALLANICSITGTFKQQATYSKVAALLHLAPSATVAAGGVAWVNGEPSNTWTLQSTVTNPGGSAADIPGVFVSTIPGPSVANAGTLTQFTPVSGWTALTNPAGAVLGLPEDTDTTLRQKRIAELSAAGSGTVAAIESDVREVSGVIAARCYENTGAVTDVDGVPPGGVHAVVWAGASPPAGINDLIAQAIWNSRPAGSPTYGAQTGTAIDDTGAGQAVYFDFATLVPIYITITGDALTSGQINSIKTALVTYGAQLVQGQSVIVEALRSIVWGLGYFRTSPTLLLSSSYPPASAVDITIPKLNLATILTGVDGSSHPYVTVNGS